MCLSPTSPGTVGVGDGRSALNSRDEGRLKIKQVAVQIGHTAEQRKKTQGGENEMKEVGVGTDSEGARDNNGLEIRRRG